MAPQAVKRIMTQPIVSAAPLSRSSNMLLQVLIRYFVVCNDGVLTDSAGDSAEFNLPIFAKSAEGTDLVI